MTNRDEPYFKIMIILLLFLLLAFDTQLATIYLLIMLGDFIWKNSDNFISFPLSRGRSTSLRVYLESAAAFGIFLAVSTFLVNVISPQAVTGGVFGGAQSLFHLLATSTPILKGNMFFTIIGWGIVVPFIETSFFNGRLLEGFATYAEKITGQKVPLSLAKTGVALIAVIFVVAAIFTLFHITAKGLSSIPLLITFIFSVISSLLVIRHRELKGAISIHIATNSLAVMASFGWL